MQAKSIEKLGGLNLRQEPADIDDNHLIKVTNLDPYRAPGTLTVRRGREALYSVGSHQIRQIARINAKRYQVISQALCRDGVALTGQILDPELETNFVGFRPLNDSHIWAFVADDAIMLKDDGEDTFLWGLEKVPTPEPKLANQTGKVSGDTITAGSYTVAVTQIRFDTDVVV